jgi:hypothetical protein
LRDAIKAQQFGIVGDGSTDNTAAFALAFEACKAAQKTLYLPAGVYLTDALTYTSTYEADQFSLIGAGRNHTTIRKRTTSTGPLFTIGSSTATNYMANLSFVGITFDGLNDTTTAAVRAFDLVRSRFVDCRFKNAAFGLYLRGGIANAFYDCIFSDSHIGMNANSFTSLAGGGVPNHNQFYSCKFVDNTSWGAQFYGGIQCTLYSPEIEGNGTTLGASEGGIAVGADVGYVLGSAPTSFPGVTLYEPYFEANKGTADAYFAGGTNVMVNPFHYSQSTQVTNDVYIAGGRWRIHGGKSAFSKTANLLEEVSANVLGGNLLSSDHDYATVSMDWTKQVTIKVGNQTWRPQASVTPAANGDVVIQATSNTSLTFKYKGSDGTVRSGSITLS